jgi:hypothetical protein
MGSKPGDDSNYYRLLNVTDMVHPRYVTIDLVNVDGATCCFSVDFSHLRNSPLMARFGVSLTVFWCHGRK